jgi:hypothetical protein
VGTGGNGGSGAGGNPVTGGSAGAVAPGGAAGAAGASLGGAAGASGTGGATNGAAAGASAGGVPGAVALSALPANGTIGLEWERVDGALGYRIYWAASAGVTPASGQMLQSDEPTFVHRGVTNGITYHYVVTVVGAGGEGPPSEETSATPTGEWVLERLGAGDFADPSGMGRVPRVPVDRRVHVLLLAEGYLASELAGFHDHATHSLERPTNDVDRWLAEVFAVEPYSLLSEAFVIWYLPRASATHVGEASAETAFGIVVSGGVSSVAAAAAPLWSALDDAGDDAFPFPPGSPVRNQVAAFLILDPTRNPARAGWSGVSTSLSNPSSQGQRIPAAFGIGHAHEFTHALAQVRDEYLENDNTVSATQPTSNVAASNTCAELPWAHLLEGAGPNMTPGLVGAFGRPGLGYRSELVCLMNGTHDNGEYYCDDSSVSLTLRPNDRLCNWCRELTAFRILDRTGVLSGGLEAWARSYRSGFYQRFGFAVPDTVPQTFRCGMSGTPVALHEACEP